MQAPQAFPPFLLKGSFMTSHTHKNAPIHKEVNAKQITIQTLSKEMEDLKEKQVTAHWDEQINALTKTLSEQQTLHETLSTQILAAQNTLHALQEQVHELTNEIKKNHDHIQALITENQRLMETLEDTKTVFDQLLENDFSTEKNLEKNVACQKIEQEHFNNILAINHLNIQQKELLPQRMSIDHQKVQYMEHLAILRQEAAVAEKNHQQTHITLNHIITEQIHTQSRIEYLKTEIAHLQE